MLVAICIIICALTWMMYETEGLSVNLPCGSPTAITQPLYEVSDTPDKAELNADIPYWWKSDSRDKCLILCAHNGCSYWNKCKKTERWTGWKIPARTIKAFNQTLNLNEQCAIFRSLLLKDIVSALKRKSNPVKVAPFNEGLFEQIEVGTHQEEYTYYSNNSKRGKGHITSKTVKDYETRLKPCLISAEWYEQHKNALDGFEATIDIVVNDKTFSVNGNYQPNLIGGFMAGYTTKTRIGRRVVRLNVGINDKV